MCLSVVASNECVVPVEPETPLLGESLVPAPLDDMDASIGKRRKMSKNDSPNSSCFDVAQLLESIHREVEGEEYASSPDCSAELLTSTATPNESSNPFVSFAGDDFDFFIDIPETPVLEEKRPEPPIFKRGSLGKRSRGLGRSQTIKKGLCMLGETE